MSRRNAILLVLTAFAATLFKIFTRKPMPNANNLYLVFDSEAELLALDTTTLLDPGGSAVEKSFAIVVTTDGVKSDYAFVRTGATGGLPATGGGQWFLQSAGSTGSGDPGIIVLPPSIAVGGETELAISDSVDGTLSHYEVVVVCRGTADSYFGVFFNDDNLLTNYETTIEQREGVGAAFATGSGDNSRIGYTYAAVLTQSHAKMHVHRELGLCAHAFGEGMYLYPDTPSNGPAQVTFSVFKGPDTTEITKIAIRLESGTFVAGSELRIWKYVLTPTNAAPTTGTVVLAIDAEAIPPIDTSASAAAVTLNGNAVRSTSQANSGVASISIDSDPASTANYISVANSGQIDLAANLWTIKMSLYPIFVETTGANFSPILISNRSGAATWWQVYYLAGNLTFNYDTGGGSTSINFPITWNLNAWNDIVIERVAGDIMRASQNGTQIGVDQAFSETLPDTGNPITIGTDGVNAARWEGFIDDIEVAIG